MSCGDRISASVCEGMVEWQLAFTAEAVREASNTCAMHSHDIGTDKEEEGEIVEIFLASKNISRLLVGVQLRLYGAKFISL